MPYTVTRAIMKALAEEYHFSLSTPFQDYPQEIRDIIIHGTNGHASAYCGLSPQMLYRTHLRRAVHGNAPLRNVRLFRE